ncbi:IclR family transcriptional regulator [Streptomyces odontomachi]|uniref:IclR family transcriptional regulator n=1 Tax=Streptomyces odontomachi TaxID=2944940 RepID=UPI00210902C9|nr:IclR family transcriptional regulator [Streptomyces sp. ODS25]
MDSTLLKGLRVLETVARSAGPRGVSELARELELTRSNVHRTMQTLVAAGYLRASADGAGYECTVKLFELGSAVMERVDVRRVAQHYIRRLAEQTAETVHLSILDDAEVVYLDKVESPQPVRAYSSIGGRAPAHCVASGKALLAALPGDTLDAFLARDLPAWTERTITDPAELARDLAQTRETGCAVNRGEWRISVAGVAAVVFDGAGRPAAAIGVSGPVDRVLPQESRYRGAVLDAAREISRELGCRTYPSGPNAGPARSTER